MSEGQAVPGYARPVAHGRELGILLTFLLESGGQT